MSDWDDEEGVAAVGNTGKGVVPGCKGGEDSENTASLDQGSVTALEVTDTEHEEGQVKGEEEEEEGDGGAESADQEEEGEDEPSHEVETKGVGESGWRGCFQGGDNLETTWSKNDGDTDPETTVRAQSSSTKGVTNSHFPHAGKKLDKTTVGESSTDDERRLGDTTSAQVDERENKSGKGESAQTERSRVGELAVVDGPVETGLELTTKGWKTDGVAGVDVSQWVSTVVVWLALSSGRSSVGHGGVVVSIDGIVTIDLFKVAGVDLVVQVVGGHCD